MLFRVVLTVSGVFVEPEGDEPVTFYVGGPRNIKVHLRPPEAHYVVETTVAASSSSTAPAAYWGDL